jgi:hypothetical protein
MMNRSNILAFLAVAVLAGCSSDPHITVPISEIDGLTETRAIELTRSALVAAKLDPDDFAPTPYWSTSPSLFASNRLDPETGYVLWKDTSRDTGLTWDYMVSIRRHDAEAVITVTKPK